jgi:tRNA threonylcarbamoyladenosine biosynthesis protein TsaE
MFQRTQSEGETAALGRDTARDLRAGDVLLLHGELGAGKTVFVRGLAEGLGIDAAAVSSPTFTLIQEYHGGRGPLFHVDLYRLTPPEVDDLGLDELVEQGIVAVEWAARWTRPPSGAIHVTFTHAGDTERVVTIDRPKAQGLPPKA